MSDGAPNIGGGMSSGAGTTTPVSSGLSRLPPPDQSVLCSANPNRSPSQDNIRLVVEIKFPNDDPTDGQLEAYALIAGDENKVVLLQATDCDCNEVEERERQAEEKVEYTLPAAEALYTLLRMYMRGRLPPLPGGSPAPVPAMP